MSTTQITYRLDAKSKDRQHVLLVLMPKDIVTHIADEIATDVCAYAQSRGYALFSEDVWSMEAGAIRFASQKYAEWLAQNVGEEDTDWSLYTMEENGLWTFIDFERKADAMLFKLTFDNQ